MLHAASCKQYKIYYLRFYLDLIKMQTGKEVAVVVVRNDPGVGIGKGTGTTTTSTSTSSSNNIYGINQVITHPTTGRQFSVVRKVGKGAFAVVYLVKDVVTGVKYACKVITSGSWKITPMDEIRNHMRVMDHSNIVKIETHFIEEANGMFHIIMEYCKRNSVAHVMETNPNFHIGPSLIKQWMIQIVNAVRHMHAHRVIHRDLKLQNLLLDSEMNIKIGDFGLSISLDGDPDQIGQISKYKCGTPNYVAPEMITRPYYSTFASDVWCIGVIMFALVERRAPFHMPTVEGTYERIKSIQYGFSPMSGLDEQALIQSILKLDPSSRISLDEILHHPYFHKQHNDQVPLNAPPDPELLVVIEDDQQRLRKQQECLIPSIMYVGPEPILHNMPWVDASVDATSNWGFFYLMNQAATSSKCVLVGGIFNDRTWMVYNTYTGAVIYTDKPRPKIANPDSGSSAAAATSKLEQVTEAYTPDNYPLYLNKKITLVKHFEKVLSGPRFSPPTMQILNDDIIHHHAATPIDNFPQQPSDEVVVFDVDEHSDRAAKSNSKLPPPIVGKKYAVSVLKYTMQNIDFIPTTIMLLTNGCFQVVLRSAYHEKNNSIFVRKNDFIICFSQDLTSVTITSNYTPEVARRLIQQYTRVLHQLICHEGEWSSFVYVSRTSNPFD